jgi:hypothetical protein
MILLFWILSQNKKFIFKILVLKLKKILLFKTIFSASKYCSSKRITLLWKIEENRDI